MNYDACPKREIPIYVQRERNVPTHFLQRRVSMSSQKI